jgi:hypothetical protein
VTVPVDVTVPTVQYASVADLVSVLAGTDSGVGTPAQLSQVQLTLALQAASSRISIYYGSIQDGSSAAAVPPLAFHDLCLDLAAFWAWKTYLKGKAIPPDHPAFIAYKDATALLNDVRDGKLRLDPAAGGGVTSETGIVINRIPPIFDGNDSNTRVDQMSGYLTADRPYGMWGPDLQDAGLGGAVYQG